MPQITERRLPELRLPKLERDEIMRAMSGVRLPDMRVPDVDISKVDVTKIDRPKIELPEFDLPRIDVRQAIDDAAVRVGIRQRRRSRWPLVAGFAIVVGLIAYALSRPMFRVQVERTARVARRRIDEMREAREAVTIDPMDVGPAETDAAWTGGDVAARMDVVTEETNGASADGSSPDGVVVATKATVKASKASEPV